MAITIVNTFTLSDIAYSTTPDIVVSGITSGNVLILIGGTHSTTGTPKTITPPTGFTEIFHNIRDDVTGGMWYRVADSGDESETDYSFAVTTSGGMCAILYELANVDTGEIVDDTGSALGVDAATAANLIPTSPAITSVTNGCLIIAGSTNEDGKLCTLDVSSNTPTLGNATQLITSGAVDTVNGNGMSAGYGTLGTAGLTETYVHTLDTFAKEAVTFAVAIKPVALDTTAPILTDDATAQLDSATTALGTVTTANDSNGVLYWYASLSATAPSIADHKSGASSSSFGSQTVQAVGEQIAVITGLTAGLSYYVHYLHVDAQDNESNQVSATMLLYATTHTLTFDQDMRSTAVGTPEGFAAGMTFFKDAEVAQTVEAITTVDATNITYEVAYLSGEPVAGDVVTVVYDATAGDIRAAADDAALASFTAQVLTNCED